MANMKLTIQHNNTLYEPPVKDDIKIEWERTGSPGKLTFTTLQTEGLVFEEGDSVCFYYGNKPIFMGYVFTKKQNKEHNIQVTCYDQIRYLKNKYTYAFEKKTATQIVKALCSDLGLKVGSMDNTSYVIPSIIEENKTVHDIILDVLEETLKNTGNMFVIYDDFGELELKNCTDMISTTLIMEDTAENFDYSSSVDNETYNQIILYYKNHDNSMVVFSASSKSTIDKWGTLRYFEEVKNPTIGKNKAESLLKLYNKKSREFTVTGAFGDINVRGGTLIPVKLDLNDVKVNNYMMVDKVTHNFGNDHYTMDLTLEGYWEDSYTADMVSKTVGTVKEAPAVSSGGSGGSGGYSGSGGYGGLSVSKPTKTYSHTISINVIGGKSYAGAIQVSYTSPDGKNMSSYIPSLQRTASFSCASGSTFRVAFKGQMGHSFIVESTRGLWNGNSSQYTTVVNQNKSISIRWVR